MGDTDAGPVSTSIVSTRFQSMTDPSVNSQPRQKLANTGPGKIVGWFTWNRAPSASVASWMSASETPSKPWR